MTTTNGQIADVLEGVIESANERGIKVAGEWRNVSRFHPLELPAQGARVSLTLDGKGFIRTLQVLEGAPATSSAPAATRDREIRRMCAMKCAVELVGRFAQTHEEVRTEHIFPLYDRILAKLEEEN